VGNLTRNAELIAQISRPVRIRPGSLAAETVIDMGCGKPQTKLRSNGRQTSQQGDAIGSARDCNQDAALAHPAGAQTRRQFSDKPCLAFGHAVTLDRLMILSRSEPEGWRPHTQMAPSLVIRRSIDSSVRLNPTQRLIG
jgi:hypothetical protein